MEKKAVRIFSVLLAVAVLMATSVPSYAASEGAETFYQIVSPLYFAWTKFQEWKEAHPNEPERKYPGYHPGGTLGGGSSREELNQKYNEYTATLPATGYNSAGKLIYRPTPADCTLYIRSSSGALTGANNPNVSKYYSAASNHFICSIRYASPITGDYPFAYTLHIQIPAAGYYKVLPELAYSYSIGSASGTSYYLEGSSEFCDPDTASSYFRADAPYVSIKSVSYSSVHIEIYCPVLEFIPDTAPSGDTYDITTRPTSITGGNYGIVGDNGQITKVEDNSTIVNETNNTYYNPATGQTAPVTDWTYDYSTRIYTLTLEGDKTSTVTYGDENITITETTVNNSGDTITNNYTIYYVIGDTGTENPPAPHVHDFQPSGTVPASCTQPGQTSYACSCGETKTEAIPALGHDWQIKQTVTTEYDDTGQLTQEGYTIYECTRCKEQYKAASGAGPPSVPDFGGSSGVFSGIFGLLLDFLSFFWNTFKDFTGAGVKAFLAALSDGTSDIFGLLNPFDWSA